MQSTTKQKVRVPADICRWPVGYASRKIYVALLVFQLRAERYQRQSVLKTYEEIAELSGVANVKTVAAAIRELSNAGYIQVKTHMYWSEDGQKLYRGTNEYTVLPLASMGAGYIWVPVKLLTARISPASFTVLLYLLRKQGQNTRSWPSLRRGFQTICQKNGKAMSRKTISAALEQLRRCMMLIVLPCLKRNKALSMNTYMVTVWGDHPVCAAVSPAAPAVADYRGGNLFGGLPVMTKITLGLVEEKKKGVSFLVHFTDKLRKIAKYIKSSFFACPHSMDVK